MEKSLERLVSDRRWESLNVRDWHLVTPWDPTPEAEKWLQDLGAGHGLTAKWKGENYVDRLAADHPNVVDYYLHGGHDRMKEAFESASAYFGTGDIPHDLTAPEVTARIQQALKILDSDPIYRYQYSFGSGTPPGLPNRPRLVMRWIAGEPDGAWRAVDIIARTAVSCDERPITVSGHFKAEPGSEFERTLQDFQAYGVPFTSPPGAYDGHIHAPGGLGGAIIDGTARVMAVDGDVGEDPVLLLQVVDPDQAVLSAVTVQRIERNSGAQGFHIVFKEQHGIFTVADRINVSTKWRQRTVTIGEIVGQPISAVHAALHVLVDSHHPNVWRLSRPNTPPELGRVDPDIDIDFPAEKRPSLETILDIVNDLQVIQSHTPDVLKFPDLDTAGSAQIRSWRKAAR